MNLRLWIPCIILIVILIVSFKMYTTEGFQVRGATYTPEPSLGPAQTLANFWSIVNQTKAGVPITPAPSVTGGSSGSGGSRGSRGSGSSTGSSFDPARYANVPGGILSLVTNPGETDTFTMVYPKYISMYALAKYDYNPVVARSALINQFDVLQNELQTAVDTEGQRRGLYSGSGIALNAKQDSCNQLNTLTMAYYGQLLSIYAMTEDLSGAAITAGSMHDENLGLQNSVTNACTNQGEKPSAACIALASMDEKLFPLLSQFTSMNTDLLDNSQTIQEVINILLRAYSGMGCSMPTGTGSYTSSMPSIDTVFSSDYLSSVQIADTYTLNSKLQELSPYYVSPNIINFISQSLTGIVTLNSQGSALSTGEEDSFDYIADMSRVTNSIVSLNSDAMPVEAGKAYSEKGPGMGGFANCPPGYVCSLTSPLPVKCPVGTYCPAGTTDNPIKCPAKTPFSLPGASDKSQCNTDWPPGYYVDSITGNLNRCPTGSYCANGTITTCPTGTYNKKQGMSSVTSCLNCPKGAYCNNSRTITPCSPGTYNGLTRQSEYYKCLTCPAGTTCSKKGMAAPTLCPRGSWSSVEGLKTACTPSDAGTYLDVEGSKSRAEQKKCTIGSFCPPGSGSPTACAAGYYCDREGLTQGTACPAGRYGSTLGLSTAECSGPCDPGYSCPPASTLSYNIPCVAGTYCPSGTGTPNICPKGHYCPYECGTPIQCPAGTYNEYDGGKALADCLICPDGKECVAGTFLPQPCSKGKFCVGGMVNDCTPGSYCDERGLASPTGCPPGTYGTKRGSSSILDCTACPGGTYSNLSGQELCAGSCTTGKICPSPNSTISYVVPPTASYSGGAATLTITIGSTQPTPCPAGYYCDQSNMAVGTPCPSGTYSSSTGLTSSSQCTKCPPGTYCPSPGAGSSLLCPPGTYCPTQGGSSPTQCAIAFICPIPGLTAGGSCPPGKLCDVEGLGSDARSSCPPGTYSTGGAGMTCTACPDGTYGTGASTTASCSGLCAAGYYCTPSSTTATTTICPIGYYCPPGTGSLLVNSVRGGSVSLSLPFVVRAGQQFTATTSGSSADSGNNWSLNGVPQTSCASTSPIADPPCTFTAPNTVQVISVSKTLSAVTLSANILVIP